MAVKAAGLNGADMLQRKGAYPAPPGSPQDIPGLELAGEVVGLGPGAERFAEGDRVMAIVGGGGQAELAVLHERAAMPVPGVDWPAAGGLAEVFVTAHDAVFTQGGLRPGERLLVHGAAGGVGTAAVQMGRAAGAAVTATVRNEDLRGGVAELGAEVIEPEGFADHGPFDVILELVGGPNMPDDLRALRDRRPDRGDRPRRRPQGRGEPAGPDGQAGAIRASTLRARPLEEKAAGDAPGRAELLPLLRLRRPAGPRGQHVRPRPGREGLRPVRRRRQARQGRADFGVMRLGAPIAAVAVALAVSPCRRLRRTMSRAADRHLQRGPCRWTAPVRYRAR